jgi:hypothetical protein
LTHHSGCCASFNGINVDVHLLTNILNESSSTASGKSALKISLNKKPIPHGDWIGSLYKYQQLIPSPLSVGDFTDAEGSCPSSISITLCLNRCDDL